LGFSFCQFQKYYYIHSECIKMSFLNVKLKNLRSNQTVKNTFWVLLGFAVRLVFQFVSFTFLARFLGVESFGTFVAILAIIALLSPFIELGGYPLVIKQISQDPSQTSHWLSNSLALLMITAPIGIIILIIVQYFLFPTLPLLLLLILAFGDFLGERSRMIASATFVAHQQLHTNAFMEISVGIIRLGLVGLLWLWGISLEKWVVLSSGGSILLGISMCFLAFRTFGRPSANVREALLFIPQGFQFSVGLAAQNMYTDIDKAMLARLSTLEATGLYGLAYRFITLAYLPLNAFLTSLYPRLVKLGNNSLLEAVTLARRTLRLTSLYGVTASLFIFVGAPIIVYIFGPDYTESSIALRWLAIVPLLQSFYWPLADALSASGYQRLRSQAQLATLVVNIGLNFWLIPIYAWKGAALATIASEVIMLLVIGFMTKSRRLRKQ
jgi:O-antigen/teichoic acid export membrane protein